MPVNPGVCFSRTTTTTNVASINLVPRIFVESENVGNTCVNMHWQVNVCTFGQWLMEGEARERNAALPPLLKALGELLLLSLACGRRALLLHNFLAGVVETLFQSATTVA